MTDKIRLLEAKIEIYRSSSIPTTIKERIIERFQEEIKEIEKEQKKCVNCTNWNREFMQAHQGSDGPYLIHNKKHCDKKHRDCICREPGSKLDEYIELENHG